MVKEDYEPSFDPRYRDDAKRAYHTVESMGARLGTISEEEVAEQYITTLQKYAPNMNKDTVLWKYLSTPIDVQNKFLDMKDGSIKQGLYHPFQMGFFRPNEECSQHRTPVDRLYMAGSCCYPGGCVIWGSGYLAANAIAEDLGIDRWWPEPEMITTARGEGLL